MGLFKSIVKKAIGAKEFEFLVAGVTFKNGRRTRQAILRAMKYKDNGFENYTITLEREQFEGQTAIAVYSNGEQIGYVPKDLVDEIDKAWKQEYMITSCEVKGNGKDTPMGCLIKAVFR